MSAARPWAAARSAGVSISMHDRPVTSRCGTRAGGDQLLERQLVVDVALAGLDLSAQPGPQAPPPCGREAGQPDRLADRRRRVHRLVDRGDRDRLRPGQHLHLLVAELAPALDRQRRVARSSPAASSAPWSRTAGRRPAARTPPGPRPAPVHSEYALLVLAYTSLRTSVTEPPVRPAVRTPRSDVLAVAGRRSPAHRRRPARAPPAPGPAAACRRPRRGTSGAHACRGRGASPHQRPEAPPQWLQLAKRTLRSREAAACQMLAQTQRRGPGSPVKPLARPCALHASYTKPA
jgi:hypothetical protein